MRRFLIFPPVFAAWFPAAQFGLSALQGLTYWFNFRFILSAIHWPSPHLLLLHAFWATIVGAIVGCVFATLDSFIHRNDAETQVTALSLLRNLLKSGVVAVAMVILCHGIWLAMLIHHPRRYQVSPTTTILLDGLSSAPPFLVLASVLWAMGKTLRSRVQ